MIATHSPLSVKASAARTRKYVYRFVTLTGPYCVGTLIGVIFLYGGLRMTRSKCSVNWMFSRESLRTVTCEDTLLSDFSQILARWWSFSIARILDSVGEFFMTSALSIPVPAPRSRIFTGFLDSVKRLAACSATGIGVRNCSSSSLTRGLSAMAAWLRVSSTVFIIFPILRVPAEKPLFYTFRFCLYSECTLHRILVQTACDNKSVYSLFYERF